MDIFTMIKKLREGEFLSKEESRWLANTTENYIANCNNSYRRIKELKYNLYIESHGKFPY